ncbi:MAG: arginyltransferase [Burkholderiales bacterium]|nr:arginyltransferase [Burkholderiales bacterium]
MTSLNDLRLLQYYLTAEYPCSYLERESARSEVAVPYHLVGPGNFGDLVHCGFRRSGIFVYRPNCRRCHACIAVRVDVAVFTPVRSQRRSWQRHCRLEAIAGKLQFEPEHFELYRRYQHARHPHGGMDSDSEEQYVKSLLQSEVDTSLYEFRENGKLLMISIIDEISDGLSSVYTFFDPDLQGASLGTYNILWQIDLCRKMGLPYLYLGYWIESSEKMAYKTNFRPIEGFLDGKWQVLP